MKLWNKCICLTSPKSLTIIVCLLISTLLIASVYVSPDPIEEIKETTEDKIWIPTKEDIEYQDSMYTIIQNTQSDVDTIKIQVQQIIKRLDYYDE